MNIRGVVLFFICVSLSALARSQYVDNTIIYNNLQIEELLNLHLKYNEAFPTIEGYRIQLLMRAGNTALDEINGIKEEFEQEHQHISTYVTFREPYYRLRIGDFRSRLEAMEYLNKIKKSYPQAWVIKDKIAFPELTKYKNTINYE